MNLGEFMENLNNRSIRFSKPIPEGEGKYLTFSLAGEDYGIGILKIKEIIGMMPITKIPRFSDHLKGVINLRGKVIPITDLGLAFGMAERSCTDRTCIIIVEMVQADRTALVGILVDSVSEVLNIKGEEIEEAPVFCAKEEKGPILGLAKVSGGIKILLNLDGVLKMEKMEEWEEAA